MSKSKKALVDEFNTKLGRTGWSIRMIKRLHEELGHPNLKNPPLCPCCGNEAGYKFAVRYKYGGGSKETQFFCSISCLQKWKESAKKNAAGENINVLLETWERGYNDSKPE